MIIKLDEFKNFFGFSFHPETIDDAAQLLRFANTAKREPLFVLTEFGEKIVCSFQVSKKNYCRYSNTLNNLGKK